jgi:hypothetical protein
MTTKDVIDNHLRCSRRGNIEGILNDCSTDAFFSHRKDSCEEELKSENCSKALLDEFGKPGASEKAPTAIFEGDYAYLVWSGETADNFYELACDRFVVRNGKITAQSFAAKITSNQSQ